MKKIIKVFLVTLIVILLTGCSSRKGSTPEEFKKIMSNKGYYVNDITKQAFEKNIKASLTANNKKYQVEYYEYSSNKDAKNAYKVDVDMLKSGKNDKQTKKNSDSDNYSSYKVETKDKYSYVAVSGKTLIYIWADIEYKKEIEKIINDLNY